MIDMAQSAQDERHVGLLFVARRYVVARQQRTNLISALRHHVTGLALYFYIQTPETCF